MSNIVRRFSMVLLIVQACAVGGFFFFPLKSMFERFVYVLVMGSVLFWFTGLMVFTLLIWYRGNSRTVKQDLGALTVISILTVFSIAGLYFRFLFN